VQIIVVIIPVLAKIFEVVQLNVEQWLITIIVSILPLPIIELQKWINEKILTNTIDFNTYLNRKQIENSRYN